MSRRLAVILLALLLGACAPVSSPDPYTMRAAAEGALQATEMARQDAAARATLDARLLEDAKDGTQAALAFDAQRTQFALEVRAGEATQAAGAAQGTQAAQATQIAADRQATQTVSAALFANQMTAVAVRATATAVALEIEQAEQRSQTAAYSDMLWLLIPPCGAAILLAVLLWLLPDVVTRWLDIWERRNHARQTNEGVIVWEADPETGYLYARLLGNRYQIIDPPRQRIDVTKIGGNWRELPAGDDGVRNVTRSGSVVESPLLRSVNPPTTSPAWAKEKVLILLKLAETINGPQSNVIPSHRHPNMLGEYKNAEPWSKAVAILKASGLCETSKSGTMVTGMLADLINSIERDEVRLSLPPLLPKSSPQNSGGRG